MVKRSRYKIQEPKFGIKVEIFRITCFVSYKFKLLLHISYFNSNCYYTSHISNRRLKFKSLQNTHSHDVYVQLQLQSIA